MRCRHGRYFADCAYCNDSGGGKIEFGETEYEVEANAVNQVRCRVAGLPSGNYVMLSDYERVARELAELRASWKSYELALDEERARSAPLIDLLKTLNTQAIVNGLPGQAAVTERIHAAIRKYEAGE